MAGLLFPFAPYRYRSNNAAHNTWKRHQSALDINSARQFSKDRAIRRPALLRIIRVYIQ